MLHGDFWEEMGWRCTYAQPPLNGIYKGFWRAHGFINLKNCVRMQNLGKTFRMKSMESFINEAPDVLNHWPYLNIDSKHICLAVHLPNEHCATSE